MLAKFLIYGKDNDFRKKIPIFALIKPHVSCTLWPKMNYDECFFTE